MRFTANTSHMCFVWSWRAPASAVLKGQPDYIGLLVLSLPDGNAVLLRLNKTETAAHGWDMAVYMRKVLARSWVGVRVCHFL